MDFQSLKDRSTQSTSHSPYTVEMKKRSFDVSDLKGTNDGGFSLETGIKTSSC